MIIELLKKVCSELEEKEIEYMLSGSLAMNIYTVPRMTRDIDIVINMKLSDINKFIKIFEEGFYIYEEGIEEEVINRRMFNVIDNGSGFKIDFIVRKNTDFHRNEFNRRQQKRAFGFKPWVVSIEDLIISKLNWIQDLKSDTQISDIENLLSVPDIDKEYIEKWCEKLNLNTYNLI
jgi:hypothetical protein